MSEGRRERQREKVRTAGLLSLAPHEVIEFLLFPFLPRKDVMPIARALLERYGSLDAMFDASADELATVDGVTPTIALYLSVLRPLMSRAKQEKLLTKTQFNVPFYAQNYFAERLCFSDHEEMQVAFLDVHYKLIKCETIGVGGVSETPVNLRQLAEKALNTRAKMLILAHNHPAGMLKPSNEDLDATKKIFSMMDGLGVEMLDHIIVSDGKTYSMWLNGDMGDLRGSAAFGFCEKLPTYDMVKN